ncbi:MAG TPA: glycosyltransferase, partial [Streptosporangiaceae bacterium]|nr:glycosyltransferase [Streptosporangiaceae bacterium]
MSPDTSHDQHVVTAVIVAHDGAAWLPRLIDSLQNQTRPLQRVVAVDTGSRDRSGAMLVQVLGRGAVFGMDRGTGYAAAVAQALRHRAAASRVPGGHDERVEWVWLLHDDCEPAPDALEELLRGADEVPAAAVLGPKVMDWNDQRMILEAGVTIDRVGRRITGLEPREVDQGQHDGDRDVVAVSTAGMLVRRDVWDHLRGFDPGFRLFREDVDFCWRVQATGFRVRLVTDAVVYHLEASARNRRPTSAAPRPRRQDRRGALLALLANLPAGPMLAATVGSTVLSLLRAMFYLLAKRAGDGIDELAALTSVVGHPFRLLGARKLRARGRRNAYGRLRADLPPGRTLQRLAEFLVNALSSAATTDTIGSHHATDDPSEDDSLLTDTGFAQRVLTNPGVLLVLALTVVALVAERSLLRGGPLGGGNLTPAWGGASALWQEYLQGFHPAGLGSAASAPPWAALMALLSTLLGGKPWLAVDVLLLGCVPLAGLTAFLAARRVTALMPVRVWVAAVYALLPVGMGAVAAGRLGTAVMFVLLPVIGLLVARIFTASPRRARRAAWAAALVTAVAAAFVPLTWIAVAVLTGAGALLAARTRKPAGLNLAIVTVVPPLLLLPWSVQVATQPMSVFLEAGLSQPGLAQAGLAGKFLLLLSPGGPGLPPYWVTGGLLLAAALTVVLAGSRPLVRAGWAIALTGLLIAAGASRLVVTPPTGGAPVAAWPGPVLALAGAGLLMSVAAAGDLLRDKLAAGRWRHPAGAALVAVAVVASAGPALGLASWVAKGVRGPVAVVRNQVLPEFVAVSADTGLRQRTLVLRAGRHGAISYEVLRDTDPLLGSSQLAMPPDAQRVLTREVASLAAPGGSAVQDQGRNLAQLGIGYVLMPSPASPGVARLLDGVAGLRPVSQTPAFRLWRVTGTAARVTVVQPGGKVVPVASGTVGASGVALPSGGGELVLAEPAGGWSASVNGHPLTPLSSPVGGWAQGFRLPAGGGRLTLGHSQLGRDLLIALEALAVLVVAGLGLPGAKSAAEGAEQLAAGRRERQPARPARDGVPRGGEPGTAPPGSAQPGTARPGAVPAAAGEPETSAWRTGRRGQRRGRVADPGPAEPGSAEPGRAEPAPAGPLATGRA